MSDSLNANYFHFPTSKDIEVENLIICTASNSNTTKNKISTLLTDGLLLFFIEFLIL